MLDEMLQPLTNFVSSVLGYVASKHGELVYGQFHGSEQLLAKFHVDIMQVALTLRLNTSHSIVDVIHFAERSNHWRRQHHCYRPPEKKAKPHDLVSC